MRSELLTAFSDPGGGQEKRLTEPFRSSKDKITAELPVDGAIGCPVIDVVEMVEIAAAGASV